jgi:hypothetical protein
MSEQIAVLERDLKAAVAENAILAAEKSAAGQQLDVRLRLRILTIHHVYKIIA